MTRAVSDAESRRLTFSDKSEVEAEMSMFVLQKKRKGP